MKVLISNSIPIVGEKLAGWNYGGNPETTDVVKATTVCTRRRDYHLVCYNIVTQNGEMYYIIVSKRYGILVTQEEFIRGESIRGILIQAGGNLVTENNEVHLHKLEYLAKFSNTCNIIANIGAKDKYLLLEVLNAH